MIELRKVHFAYPGAHRLLRGADLEIRPGEVVALAGPNGAGKSTLLRIAAGLLAPSEGEALLDGRPVESWSRVARAKQLAYVAQSPKTPEEWRVSEIVELGDYPHREQPPAPRPLAVRLEEVRRRLGLAPVWERRADSLSGGEAQKVSLARALVQDTRNLVLDEPASHLDLANQMVLFRSLSELAAQGRSVLLATHDVNLSRLFGQRLVLLNGEGVVKPMPEGAEEQGRLLRQAFGVAFRPVELSGTLCWFPDPRGERPASQTPGAGEGEEGGPAGPDGR